MNNLIRLGGTSLSVQLPPLNEGAPHITSGTWSSAVDTSTFRAHTPRSRHVALDKSLLFNFFQDFIYTGCFSIDV